METNIDKIFEMEEKLMNAKESKVAKKFKVLDRVKIKLQGLVRHSLKGSLSTHLERS